uniref:Uncharacterized protein n=1 Tax=Oryza nivara TaxID=4536 RepID=A0A0E0HCN1_ORYNI
MAAADAVAPDDGDHAVLRDDECGIPRSLSLLAALVEAEALCHATAADADADSDLIRAFRGGATPTVRIGEFLERIHTFIQQESVRHVIEIQGACYVLAGIYLIRSTGSVVSWSEGRGQAGDAAAAVLAGRGRRRKLWREKRRMAAAASGPPCRRHLSSPTRTTISASTGGKGGEDAVGVGRVRSDEARVEKMQPALEEFDQRP